jgi:3-hydroxyacyl-CoA dehydrogenase / enoyl-CoA hydratase / 3-hydroxybutyryl-CoA epimerase
MADNETIYRHWRIERDRDDILWLYLDRAGEKINSLSSAVLEELEQLISYAEITKPRGLAILSAKTTGFVYGADVREFDSFSTIATVTAAIERVHDMFRRLENLPCTTVTAVEGYCLGGGLELALACDYRIAKDVPSTKFGFPEVQLGIFPGFGGSARSVATIGGLKAMELMLSARQVGARAARAMGLIDEVVGRHEELHWAARRAVLSDKRSRSPALSARLTNTAAARKLLADQMRKKTAARARKEHYPAPYRLIDLWEQHGGDTATMMREEARAVGELMQSSTAVGLRRVFALMERLKTQGKQSSFKARRVHVIGAGVMGGDIAAWCVLRGLEVSLQDRELKFIEPALQRAARLFKKKLRDPAKVKAALERLRPDVSGHLVAQADVVIEAIFENLEAKQTLFRTLEPQLKAGAVLATNTSAIPLEQLAAVLQSPERLIGLHFFNPVASMPLVEIIRSEHTDAEQISKAAAFCAQINRFPLLVKSSPGFLVNRVLGPYMMTALRMHLEGTPAEAIDAAAETFGMPMGPVELADTVGLDVCLMVTNVLGEGQGEAERQFIKRYVDAGKLGKKSGEGLYLWKDEKAQKQAEKIAGHDLSAISERLVDAYINECEAALKDGIVADADLLDAGMIFGTGFAPFRGGPLYYRQQTGQKQPPQQQTGDQESHQQETQEQQAATAHLAEESTAHGKGEQT